MPDPMNVRGVADLVRLQEAGERLKFLFFWGHTPPRVGAPGTACLSQWWPSPFSVDGITYATAEHWMMAEKARLFGDDRTAAQIVAASHPRQAKDLGRRVRGFDEQTWVAHRSGIVVQGNLAKFGRYPEAADYLRGTRGRILVEASPLDRVWGIGLAAGDEEAETVSAWRGLNLLGFALMDVRDKLG